MSLGVALIPIMFFFLFAGVNVAFGIGMAVVSGVIFWNEIPMMIIFQQYYQGIDSYALLAIALFMFAGSLMMELGLVNDIIAFARVLVGRLKASLAYVNIVANVFFAAISGSALADMTAIGKMLIPKMEEENYDTDFAVGLIAAASVIGPIIPPSIPMVVYASSMGVSVGAMFIGGVIPGIMLGISLAIISYFICKKRGYGVVSTEKITIKEKGKIVIKALPALMSPIIVLGGIFSGYFTPTESAAIVCLYALILGGVYYRTLTLKTFLRCTMESMVSSAVIYLIVGVAKPFSWLVAMTHLAETVTNLVESITTSPYVYLLILNIILLILGCLMETSSSILIFAPLLAPIAIQLGCNELHVAVIFVLNLMLGVATPPFGMCLFIGAGLTKRPMGAIFKSVVPFIIVEIIVLFICTYVPVLVTGLPAFFGY